MEEQKNPLQSNQGFSLVELIVTLMISSIIVLAIGGFLSVAIRAYQSTNSEVAVQLEAQIATNQMTELLREAKSYEFEENYIIDGIGYPVLKINVSDETGNYRYYLLLHETEQLLLYQRVKMEDVVDEETNLRALLANPYAVLAKYITHISISPLSLTTATNQLVQITVTLDCKGKEYISNSNVSRRTNGN